MPDTDEPGQDGDTDGDAAGARTGGRPPDRPEDRPQNRSWGRPQDRPPPDRPQNQSRNIGDLGGDEESEAGRRRRRAQFLRELHEAKALRERVKPRRARAARMRQQMRMRTFRW